VVDSSPRGAEVYRAADGVKLGETPLLRELDRSDGEMVFVLKHVGYEDRRVAMRVDRDGEVKLDLVRRRSPARPENRQGPDAKERARGELLD
jgi:hypothetical protein